jgi:ketosteroid isomerase-like protein
VGHHTDSLRERYEAFQRGDLEAALDLAHDDVLWQGTTVENVPGAGEHRGKQALVRMIAAIPAQWDDFSLSADQFVEEGDTVVVLGHVDATAKATGKPVKVPFAHVITFEDDKVRRMTSLADTAIFVAALDKKPTAH